MAGFSLYCLRNCFLVAPLFVHFCQTRLICPNQPVIATAGEGITLPCHLLPGENVAAMTLEWTRPDLDPRFVFVCRAGQELINGKNPYYKGRSSLFTDELKHGNISLKLFKVKPADEGRYRCYIPEKDEEVFIDLVVGAATSPVISLSGMDKNRGGVVLQCESAGWYPEPELLWLDGEGNLLSAGPTETLRGPDDLYTVSSRVTVEKRHSNNITCRVQQRNTNQSRETHIHVPDEYFQFTSSSAAPIIIGVVVSLALSIILILIVVFFIWRRNKTNLWKPHCLRKKQETTKTEPDEEQETLMTQNIETSGGSTTLTKYQQLMEQNIKNEKSSKKEFEKNQHAAEEKLKEEHHHHHLQKKHAEISNMKKDEENLETDKKLKEDDKKQDFQQEAKQPDVTEVNHQNTPEPDTPGRTNTRTFVATTETRAEESPGWRHPAGTEQKPLASVGMSSQTQPATGCTTADRPLSPDTRGPRAPNTPTGAHQSQGAQARPSSHQEEKHEADKKLNEDEKQDFQQEEKQLPTKDFWKQKGVSKHTGFQEHNKSSSANYNLKTSDLILDEFDGHAPYICLRNTSSEDKLLTCWNIELQINNKKPVTYKFERNFTLKAGEGLTLRGAGVRNPHPNNADLMWQELFKCKSEDHLKISLISSSGEKHQLEKKHAAEEKLKEEHHHHLQKKHAEISNMKKEPETSKPQPEKSQTSFEEQNKSCSANHSSKTGDITVVEVERNGNYICLRNTSSEDKLMSDWKLKLQINNRESATYEFKENFILKAGETLLLRQDAVNKPIKTDADLLWMNMVNWNIGDDVKIDLIGNTGEEQMLLKNKIM